MVAQWVQHYHAIAATGGYGGVQATQQDLVQAAFAVAQVGILRIIQRLHRQSLADALAAGLVVAPQGVDTGVLQHMQQRLVIADLLLVVVVPTVG